MIKEGDEIPDVILKCRTRSEHGNFIWKDIYVRELFSGKKILLIGIPGAFTPTCTDWHIPQYEKSYPSFKSLGIDDIFCISVNDAFVMYNWGLSLGLPEDPTPNSLNFKNVKLLPDGTGEFTRKMGLGCEWTTNRGFGMRSWRYAAIIENGIVKNMFIERPFIQNSEDDPFELSKASNIIDFLEFQMAIDNKYP